MAFPFLSKAFRRKGKPTQTRRFDGGTVSGRRGFGMGQMGRINSEVSAAGTSLRSRASYLAINNAWVSQGVANWAGALAGHCADAETHGRRHARRTDGIFQYLGR